MKPVITFETWKGKKVIVIRNENKKFISWKIQKGSGIKTKEQAYKVYKKNNSLDKQTVRISRNNPKTNIKSVNTVTIKGKDKSKNINVKDSNFQNATQIGKNTVVLRSKRRVKNQQYYQIIAKVKWGDKVSETIGYSDIKGTPEQAFNRARSGAIMKGLISYDHKIKFEGKFKGIAYKPNNIVYFEVNFEVQTYVNTTKSYATIKN